MRGDEQAASLTDSGADEELDPNVLGKMRMINWQGSRLLGGTELLTVLRELLLDNSTEKRELSFADLNRSQTRFVQECAKREGLRVERSFMTLRVSRPGHHHHTHRTRVRSQISEIIDGFLYLGAAQDLHDADNIRDRKIQRIINCAKECKHNRPDLVTLSTFWEDSEVQSIADGFDAAFLFLDEAREKKEAVFVHCMVGKSRSAALVIAYLIRSFSMDLKNAFDHVRRKRIIVKPNNGFMKQLIEYETKMLGKSSLTMEQFREIFHPPKEQEISFVDTLRASATSFCKKNFPESFYAEQYAKTFEDSETQAKDVGNFIMSVSMHVSQDRELLAKLSGLQLQMSDINKELAIGCKEFFHGKFKHYNELRRSREEMNLQ